MRRWIGQVIASLLIIQRVANRSALTSHAVTTGHASWFNVRNKGKPTDSEGTPIGGHGKHPDGLQVEVETQTHLLPDGGA